MLGTILEQRIGKNLDNTPKRHYNEQRNERPKYHVPTLFPLFSIINLTEGLEYPPKEGDEAQPHRNGYGGREEPGKYVDDRLERHALELGDGSTDSNGERFCSQHQ